MCGPILGVWFVYCLFTSTCLPCDVSGFTPFRSPVINANHFVFALPPSIRLPDDTFYDGGRIIYSIKPLKDVTEQGLTKEEPIPDQLERDDLVLKYVIKQVGRVSARTLLDYVSDRNACTFQIPQDSINMVDCILKNVNKSNYVLLGRTAAYIKEPQKTVGHKLFWIYRGFLASCRPQWKVRLNIDMVSPLL
ncbi:unnamed protein product [Dibothriocephalus latus]|uniref:Uncharacterized protein n=1 Tax=Dibothriocephalus latus TaxID=60516 RepID=A0A3P7M9Y1_DIBLA|nr:unnamed protein product [Dibothriocephalus latus]